MKKAKPQTTDNGTQEIDALKKELAQEYGIDGKQATELAYGLLDAKSYHQQVGTMLAPSNTHTESRKTIEEANKRFKQIHAALNSLNVEDKNLLDTLYYEANNRDTLLMDFPPEQDESAFEVLCRRMQKAVCLLERHYPKTGRGTQRREGKKYIAGIERLMKHFAETMPQHEISPEPESKFHTYVKIWFEKVLHTEEKLDLSRHITNTLTELNQRRYL